MNPDAYIRHARSQPGFEATDVLSQTSTADKIVTADGDDDYIAIFDKLEQETWTTELTAMVPKITQQAKASANLKANFGAEAGQAREDTREMKRGTFQ